MKESNQRFYMICFLGIFGLVLVTPLLLLVFIPVWIYSVLVPLYVNTFISKTAVKSPGYDMFFFLVTGNSLPVVHFSAKVEAVPKKLEILRQFVTDRIVDVRTNTGELQFPKFSQRFFKYGGYIFWDYDQNFSIENHVKEVDLREIYPYITDCNEKLCLYMTDFQVKKSSWEGIPPWEFIRLISGESEFFYLFRFHHAIGDGFSITRLYQEFLNDKPAPFQIYKQPDSFMTSFKKIFKSIFFVPYTLTHTISKGNKNALHGSPLTGMKHYIIGEEISLDRMKLISKKTHVSIEKVLFAAISAAFSKVIGKISPEITNFTVLYPTGYNDNISELKMVNRVPFRLCEIPLEKPHRSKKSLSLLYEVRDSIEDSIQYAVGDTVSYLTKILADILPFTLGKLLYNTEGVTTAATNIPGPSIPLVIMNDEVKDFRAWGHDIDPQGIGFVFYTYCGKFKPALMIDDALIGGRKQAQNLMNSAIGEIHRISEVLGIET